MPLLAITYNNLSFLHSKNDPAKAEQSCLAALAIQQQLVQAHPASTKYLSDLALSHNNLAALRGHAGRPEDAAASYRQAIAIQQQLLRKAPLVIQFRRDLAVSLNNLGRTYSSLQQPAEATAPFQQARALVQDLVDDYPQELSYRSSLGGILNNLALILEQRGEPEQAAATYEEAILHQRFAHENAPGVARFREFLNNHYVNYGRVLRTTGRLAKAAETALLRQQLDPRNPKQLYSVATELAQVAQKYGSSESDVSGEAAAAKQQLVLQATATLREAVDAGFDQFDRIREDPDLSGIRDEPEFGKLIQTFPDSARQPIIREVGPVAGESKP